MALAPALPALAVPLPDFDLTIRDTGTYAVSAGSIRPIETPRSRREAEFHVAADVLVWAEVLAGLHKRMGRWHGSVRLGGRRAPAERLVAALRASRLTLSEAVRAGAHPPPELAFRMFAYAIDPAWTRGHRFTVAQVVDGAAALVVVGDGAPVRVERGVPPQGADATVSMTRAGFDALLRREPATGADRPVVRGNRAAVALLKAWTDRAQGQPG